MAIKDGWDFPSPSNASTRGYTRERGHGDSDVSKDPPPNTNKQGTGRPYSRTRYNPRDQQYTANNKFTDVPQDKNEDAQLIRTGQKATQTNPKRAFATGGSVKKSPSKG